MEVGWVSLDYFQPTDTVMRCQLLLIKIMACYSPLLMYDTGNINPDTGKPVMKFLGRTKELFTPDNPDAGNIYVVPCNRCIGCRLDYARQWSNRLLLELLDNPDALFITLTYDNDHLPMSDKGFPTVSVRDCQLFMKRLRRYYNDHLDGRKIRYFLTSEYGPKTKRPHYHGIFFGMKMSDFEDLTLYKFNNLRQPLYISKTFASIWENGFCTIGSVSRDTCAYTARYMLKKVKGLHRLDYDEKGIHPEFSLMSRRPGIGMKYLDNHPDISNEITVFDGTESVSFPLPKKLFDKVSLLDPDKYLELKALRRYSAWSNELLEFRNSDLEYLEYLDMKESELYRKIKGIDSTTRLDI